MSIPPKKKQYLLLKPINKNEDITLKFGLKS